MAGKGFKIADAYVEVSPDTSGFEEKLRAELDRIRPEARVRVTPDLEGFRERLRAAIDEARVEARVRVRVDTSGGDLNQLTQDAQSAGQSAEGAGGGFNMMAAAIAGIALATPAISGLGGALTAVLAPIGVMTMALSGVKQAIDDAGVAQENAGREGAQFAATELANSIAITNAQQAIVDAKRQAADAQISAAQSVASAQQALTNAEYSEQQATVALSQAWQDATRNLQQLNDQAKDAALGVEAAQLALEQAEQQQRLTNQNAMTTSLQRRQADLAVEQAQQRRVEAQQRATQATQDANKANELGVAGSKTVVDAQHAAAQAHQSTQNAQQQLANAQRLAAEQQVTSAEAVQKAVDNLANTQKQQALAAAAASQTASQTFASDMAKMTQAGRDFVNEILTDIKPAFSSLKDIAQETVLPGLTQMFRDLMPLMPMISQEVGTVGKMLGGLFVDIGNVLKSSTFKTELQSIFDQANTFLKILGPAFEQFGGALMQFFAAGAPAVEGLAQGLAAIIGTGLPQFFQALTPAIGPIGSILSTLGQAIAAILPPIGQLIAAVDTALAPVLKALLPGFQALVTALGNALAPVISALGPPLTAIAQALSQVLVAVSPLLVPIGQILAQALGAVGQAIIALLPGVTNLLTSLTPLLAPILGLVTAVMPLAEVLLNLAVQVLTPILGLLPQLVPPLTTLMTAIVTLTNAAVVPLLPVITQLGGLLAQLLMSALVPLMPAITQIIGVAGQLLLAIAPILPPITQLLGLLIDLALKALTPLIKVISDVVGWLGKLLATVVSVIADVIAAVVKFAVDLPKHIRELWSWVKDIWHDGTQWIKNTWHDWLHGIEDAASTIWTNVRNAVSGFFGDIKSAFNTGVDDLKAIWTGLQDIMATPVRWVVTNVYTKGVEHLWNEVAKPLGMPVLPDVTMAGGGVIPGYAPGRDVVNAKLSPGEGVLVPEAVQAIGPGTVHALNAAYGQGRKSTGAAFSGGGIFGDIWGDITSAAKGIGSLIANPSLDGIKHLLDAALSPLSHLPGASTGYGKMITGEPKKFVDWLIQAFTGRKTSSGAGWSGGTVASGQLLDWIHAAEAAAGVDSIWDAGLSTIISHESGGNPNAINLWDSNALAGHPSQGLMQTIPSTFAAYVPAALAGLGITNPVANIAAGIRYIESRYGGLGNVPGLVSMAHGGGYVGYDSGGWLMPSGIPVNGLSEPEAVLDPTESKAFVALVRNMLSGSSGGSARPSGEAVSVNFFGTQYPNAEQMAAIRREFSTLMGV